MHVAARTHRRRRSATPWVLGLVALWTGAAWAGPRRAVKPLVTAQVQPARQVRASLVVRVKDVGQAAGRLRTLASSVGAEVESERREASYSLVVRVPPQQVQRFVDGAAALGEVGVRNVQWQNAQPGIDATARRRRQIALRLEHLQAAVQPPPSPDEGSMLDSQISEWQAQLEELDAERAAQEDAVARGWVEVTLTTDAPTQPPPPPPISDHDILFYPGVRVASLVDLGNSANVALWGVGLSLQPEPWLSFEASFFRSADRLTGRNGADAFLFTVGLDATSRLFGRGKRESFNPHLGLRVGVGASFGRVDAVTGVSLGLELVRWQRLIVDVQVRALGQWLNRRGPHVGIESGLTLATAW